MRDKKGIWIPDSLVVLISIIWIVAIVYFIFTSTTARATFIIVILGLFVFLAFFTIAVMLIKNQLPFGTHAALSIVALLLTIEQINHDFKFDSKVHNLVIIGSLSLLLLISVLKLWDILSQ